MRTHTVPSQLQSTIALWKRNATQFLKSWKISLFWILLEPLFVLAAMGFGLGASIAQIQGQSYLDFFFPALVCNTAMLVSFFECTYTTYTKLSYTRIYQTSLLAPLSAESIHSSEILWGVTKSLISAVGVSLVAWLFGVNQAWKILFLWPLFAMVGALTAAFGMVVTSKVRSYDQIVYPSSGLVIPLSLFSGTYFPIESMHPVFQGLAYLSPLTHAVSASRLLYAGIVDQTAVFHTLVLLILTLVAIAWSQRIFVRRLMD